MEIKEFPMTARFGTSIWTEWRLVIYGIMQTNTANIANGSISYDLESQLTLSGLENSSRSHVMILQDTRIWIQAATEGFFQADSTA